MPLRPDLPTALNLSRRSPATPVKLPRMSFPMVGGPVEVGKPAGEEYQPPVNQMEPAEVATPMNSADRRFDQMDSTAPAQTWSALQGRSDFGAMAQAPMAQAPMAQAPMAQSTAPQAAPPMPEHREAGRVVVYGRSGSAACLEAVQDLLDRQVSFAYFDVDRDAGALEHLQVICGGEPVVPVIVYIGFRSR